MEVLQPFLDFFLNLDQVLKMWVETLGPWFYVVMFLIVFCETGLVVTPILPGDSLLFTAGAIAAWDGSPISLYGLLVLMIAAAVAGDSVNYFLGQKFGVRAFQSDKSRLFNKKHLIRTQDFYAKYGGKTIIIARFIPIVRTFAPFVAGIGRMNYRKFWLYNVVGGVGWVGTCLFVGFVFGNSGPVKRNFHFVIFAIIFISVLPMAVEFLLAWRRRRLAQQPVSVE
ncbi:MAG: DedA family protein [Gemmataceae bacterium]